MRLPSCTIRAFNVKPNSLMALSAWLVAALHAAAPLGAGAQTAGWQTETRLTYNESVANVPPNNAKYLAVDRLGVLHVVWSDDRDRNFEIYHRMKTGGTWGAENRLTISAGISERPNLAVDETGRVHLAWNDDRSGNMEIYHRFWASGVWSPEQRVTETAGDSRASALVAVGDTVHMVYMEMVGTVTQIMHRTWSDMAWSAGSAITSAETGDRMVPTIDRGPDGSIHVAWWDTRTDGWGSLGKTYYRKKEGATWLDEELVTDPSMGAMRPTIAVDDLGYVHVAWIDQRDPNYQIYYRRRTPAGWESEQAITDESCTHYHPSIDTAGGRVFLVYWDNHIDYFNSEIFFTYSSSGSWWNPTRISDGEGTSDVCCLIAEPNMNLHAAWIDMRDGNREVYYRQYIDAANGVGERDGGSLPPPAPFSVAAFPNPFREATRVIVSVDERCAASIDIYAVDGSRVRSLARTVLPAGIHEVPWDGRDDAGRSIAPGLYVAVVKAGKKRGAAKILLFR